jgi:hypothetical protein
MTKNEHGKRKQMSGIHNQRVSLAHIIYNILLKIILNNNNPQNSSNSQNN